MQAENKVKAKLPSPKPKEGLAHNQVSPQVSSSCYLACCYLSFVESNPTIYLSYVDAIALHLVLSI
jgi:hypothetical protein